MNLLKKRNIRWILGTFIAMSGVATVNIIAPELAGTLNKVVLISGYLLSLTGIIILARASVKI